MEEDNYLKRQRIYKNIMLVVLTAFLTFILTTIYMTKNNNNNNTQLISSLLGLESSNDNQLTKSIKYVKTILDKYYLNDIDEDKAAEGALKGYVASLGDPYT